MAEDTVLYSKQMTSPGPADQVKDLDRLRLKLEAGSSPTLLTSPFTQIVDQVDPVQSFCEPLFWTKSEGLLCLTKVRKRINLFIITDPLTASLEK